MIWVVERYFGDYFLEKDLFWSLTLVIISVPLRIRSYYKYTGRTLKCNGLWEPHCWWRSGGYGLYGKFNLILSV